MRIYNSYTKSYCSFQPSKLVKIYVCGITPYDSAHLGHIFTFMTYDLLQRRLEDSGHKVKMIRNITDVDEPIYAKADELGTDYVTLANSEISSFKEVLKNLNFRSIYAEPKASEYITPMAEAVKKLIDSGYGYYVEKDVYFDTAKYPDYGQFCDYSEQLKQALLKNRGGNPKLAGKRNSLDFLLWRNIDNAQDLAQWQTILGTGRPGWHIECSVMSSSLLGDSFDLHGGGSDLIFPHHESEIAQNVALFGSPPTRQWLHISPMLMAGEKMSKSLGNMVFAKDLLKKYDASTIRLALMHFHHRMGGEWQPDLIDAATNLLKRFNEKAKYRDDELASRLLQEVRLALDDDINTLEVIDALHRFINQPSKQNVKSSTPSPELIKTLDLLGLSTSR